MRLQLALAFSLGVHLLAFLSFILVEDGRPQVRGFRRFVGAITLWLLLALLAELGIATPGTGAMAGVVAHFLPIVLLLGATLPWQPLPGRAPLIVLMLSIVLLPFTVSASPWHRSAVEFAYYAAAWSWGGAAVFHTMRARTPAMHRGRWMLAMALLVTGVVAIGWLAGMGALGVVAIVSAILASVVLYATVRLSLYTVRETASRTGALAADAAELDRRAVAGEISAMVAHEVRNPLTGVRSLAQRLADDEVAADRRRSYADLIVREVDRIEQMIAALLGASAGLSSSDSAETNVGQLFDDVALLVAGRFRRSGVNLARDAEPLVVAAPRAPLAQVLLNLLINAVQQSPSVRNVQLGARSLEGDRTYVELFVRDDGPGIRPDVREAIWRPFHSGTGGTGLGLAVVHRLCAQWGWRAEVRDNPERGVTFVIAVPSSDAPRGGSPPTLAEAAAASERRR